MLNYSIDPRKVEFKKDNKWLVSIGVSNHHIHLSQKDIDALFGEGYQLTVLKHLKQYGEFASKETVNVVGKKGVIEKVRILGPARKESQVELSRTTAIKIGIDAPIRNSGDLDKTPGCVLIGPNGPVLLEKGVIIPKAHIHLNVKDAEKLEIINNEKVSILIKGTKVVCYHDVLVRLTEKGETEFHIDTDEANAAFVDTGDLAMIKHKEIIVKDNYGNVLESNTDNIKFIRGRMPHEYFTQEGLRLLRNVFELPASTQRNIADKLLNPAKIDPNKFYIYTAVEDEDKVVGIACFYYLENVKFGYLEHIGITPEYQCRGIGSFFYHKVLSFLEKEHPELEGMLLEVRQTKHGLDNRKEFFLNLGAIPVDTAFYPSEKLKKGEDLLLMFKPSVVDTFLNTGVLERAFGNLAKTL